MSDREQDRAAFVAILEPLALALRATIDQPTWTVYYRALRDVSLPLLQASVEIALHEPERKWFPTVPEFRAFARSCRLAILEVHPYRPGDCCQGTGWSESELNGVKYATRCPCWRTWLEEVRRLEFGESVPRELSAADPTLVQSVIERVAQLVLSKRMPAGKPLQTDLEGQPL